MTSQIFSIFVIWDVFRLCVLTHSLENDNGRLIAASVIFRHGDRTPVEPYPTDPYKDPSFWPTGFGMLTNIGKRQHYELGKWLRNRYSDIVGPTYNADEMVVRSTDMDRTLMSALADLSGFYPPIERDVWNQDINWQPIPVHTVPEKLDEVLAAKKPCPVYDNELKRLYKSPESKAFDKKFKPIYKYLTKHTGKTVDSLQSVQNIFSCLFIEEVNNFTLPDWTKEVYPEKMFEISGLSFAVKTYTNILARLKMGPLLKEILTHYQNKTKGHLNPNRNLFIYSAHDTTIANMLNTLGVFHSKGFHNPPFAATILFELREINGENFVQVFYKNSTEARLLDLPNCGTLCPLDKMFLIYKDILPENWERECQISILQMPLDASIEESLSLVTIFGFVILMFLVGIFVLYIATVYKQRRTYLSANKWNNLNTDWN